MRAGPGRRRGERGASLLEALLAAVILLVVLGIAGEFLAEAGRRLAFELERARGPIDHVVARLEADVRLAAEARVAPDPDGPYPLLRLDGHPAGRVEWRRTLGVLERRVSDGDGSVGATMLENLRAFEVVVVPGALGGGDLVVADVTYLRAFRVAGPTHLVRAEARIESVRACAAPRRDPFP